MKQHFISKEDGLVINYFSGDISVSDVKERMSQISADPDFSLNYDILNDFRDSHPDIDHKVVGDYIKYLKDELQMLTKRKCILLTSKPEQVALSIIFSKLTEVSPLIPFVCSSVKASADFLEKEGLDRKKLDKMIGVLKIQGKGSKKK